MSYGEQLERVRSIFEGSNANATRELYADLLERGVSGKIAMNTLRAMKASHRAKVYRGGNQRGRYSRLAYDKKSWCIDLLAQDLAGDGAVLNLTWGWGTDLKQPVHQDVIYIDLPTGQISFHTTHRTVGPDYPGEWDGVLGVGPSRVCRWAAKVLERPGPFDPGQWFQDFTLPCPGCSKFLIPKFCVPGDGKIHMSCSRCSFRTPGTTLAAPNELGLAMLNAAEMWVEYARAAAKGQINHGATQFSLPIH